MQREAHIPNLVDNAQAIHARTRPEWCHQFEKSYTLHLFMHLQKANVISYDICQGHGMCVIRDLVWISLGRSGKGTYPGGGINAMPRSVVWMAIDIAMLPKPSNRSWSRWPFVTVVWGLPSFIGIGGSGAIGDGRKSGLQRMGLIIPDCREARNSLHTDIMDAIVEQGGQSSPLEDDVVSVCNR